MDERSVHELKYPVVGNYCHSANSGYKLIRGCHDLAVLLGRSEHEMVGKELSAFLDPEKSAQQLDILNRQIRIEDKTEIILTFVCKDGSLVNVLSCGRVENDANGCAVLKCVFMAAEKTGEYIDCMQKKVEQYKTKLSQTENRISDLQIRAEQDSLTNIFNARTTKNLCKEYLEQTKCKCALLIIDVDDFKRINDRYGHMTGDRVMICAANAIKKLFRVNDIVGRVGGDEFLVLMKDVPETDIVYTRCEQINTAFNKMQIDGLENETISCSVGAAVSCVKGIAYDKLFLCADKAMYRAKKNGGNQYFIEECE